MRGKSKQPCLFKSAAKDLGIASVGDSGALGIWSDLFMSGLSGSTAISVGFGINIGEAFAEMTGNSSGEAGGDKLVSITTAFNETVCDSSGAAEGGASGSNTNITIGSATAGAVTTTTRYGNTTVDNLTATGLITATGNITGGNIATAGQITATGNITGTNIRAIGGSFFGDGSGLTGISTTGGYFNSTLTAFPTGDYGNGEPFVEEGTTQDAFGVTIVPNFSCMDPQGSITPAIDLGAL
jgi:hypothetical protein